MILDTIRSEVSLAPSGVSHSQPVCMIVEDQSLIGFALKAYLEEQGLERVRYSGPLLRHWHGSPRIRQPWLCSTSASRMVPARP